MIGSPVQSEKRLSPNAFQWESPELRTSSIDLHIDDHLIGASAEYKRSFLSSFDGKVTLEYWRNGKKRQSEIGIPRHYTYVDYRVDILTDKFRPYQRVTFNFKLG